MSILRFSTILKQNDTECGANLHGAKFTICLLNNHPTIIYIEHEIRPAPLLHKFTFKSEYSYLNTDNLLEKLTLKTTLYFLPLILVCTTDYQ
jgi:hypothetical protein